MLENTTWLIFFGLGSIWLGSQIFWVGGLPRQLQRGEVKTAEKGSERAFLLFWRDQYSWIGITLISAGIIFVLIGVLL